MAKTKGIRMDVRFNFTDSEMDDIMLQGADHVCLATVNTRIGRKDYELKLIRRSDGSGLRYEVFSVKQQKRTYEGAIRRVSLATKQQIKEDASFVIFQMANRKMHSFA